MKKLIDTLDELVKKKMEIEQWKKEHPDMTEIVQLIEDYLRLFDDVYKQCQPPTVIGPYPFNAPTTVPILNPGIINPAPNPLSPYLPYKITCRG